MALTSIIFFAFFFIFDLFTSSAAAATGSLHENSLMTKKHNKWMARFQRVYKDDKEKAKRFQIFKENVKFIESFNSAANRTFVLGLNEFSDLSREEFVASRTGYVKPSSQMTPQSTSFRYQDVTDSPSSIDWREKGAVTDVENQENCGCCWALSTAAAVEGIHQISGGSLISLSGQQLVDCNTDNNGCGGGNMVNAFEFIEQNGITASKNYPYQGSDNSCDSQASNLSPRVMISGYENVPQNSESELLKAVANQPVSVAIDVGGCASFMHYQSGIFSENCGTDLDHAVALVGYGVDEATGTKYWLVKNSWGTNWGENGYMRLQREADVPEGLCGVAMQPSYPVITK